MDEFKRIATNHLIDMLGKDWVTKNKDNICTMFYDNDFEVRIVFCLTNMLPSEEETIENKASNYQPEGSISFDVNKKDKMCKVFRNLLP